MHLHWTKSAVLSMLCVRATRSPPTLIASYGEARGPQAAQLRRHPPIQRPAPLLNLHQSLRSSENRTTRTDASTEGRPSIRRRRHASFTTRSAWILYAAARGVSPNSKTHAQRGVCLTTVREGGGGSCCFEHPDCRCMDLASQHAVFREG